MSIIFSVLSYFLGIQINVRDFNLLFHNINYKIQKSQVISFSAMIIAFILLLLDVIKGGFLYVSFSLVISIIIAFVMEFFWSRINTQNRCLSILYRLIVISLLSITFERFGNACFIVMGIYLKNTIFGAVHAKDFCIASRFSRTKTQIDVADSEYVDVNKLPDFSKAGNNRLIEPVSNRYNVKDYGVESDKKEDQSDKINELIEIAGRKGGGIIYFPAGKYYFNTQKGKQTFIQINFSNISLEGEVDLNGNPMVELVNCNHLAKGERNPWLSPFLITTGEKLQKSNWFWGLQFRKKKEIFTKSVSSSDPGSNGDILQPKFVTKVIADAVKGSDILYVEDASTIGQFIMLGLYNTDQQGSLIKDILGVDIRPEWKTPLRAGEEEAPSFQWLVEVAEIIDRNTIRLVQPLWRDCLISYEPEIFNVEMIQNVCIRNLIISSTWNGLFKHHGFRGYYSVSQAQEMDYGWNAINMKRVAYGSIENVHIHNYTNPLYIMDSRNVTVRNILISGYDGHQGIKLYEHACDNLIENVTFTCEYADMMGGEGNAYGNVFSNIQYLNPEFKPCDYDFHGFSEGPMSPPAYNLFEKIYGFRYIKMGGAEYNQPACAQWNVWWNCQSEGEQNGDNILVSLHYPASISFFDRVRTFVISMLQVHPIRVRKCYYERMNKLNSMCMSSSELDQMFRNIWLCGYISSVKPHDSNNVRYINFNKGCIPSSLYKKK